MSPNVPLIGQNSDLDDRQHDLTGDLEGAPSDPLPILLASVTLAIGVCFVLGLRRVGFVAGVVAATAIFYMLGGFVRTLVASPKRRARSAPLPAKRLHARH